MRFMVWYCGGRGENGTAKLCYFLQICANYTKNGAKTMPYFVKKVAIVFRLCYKIYT